MAIDGEPVPGTFAAEDELFGLGRVLGDRGTAVFELAPAGALGEDLAAPELEMAWMRKLGAAIGRPITFALTQNDHDPDAWRDMLRLAGDAVAEGARIRPQVAGRPVTLLLGLQTFHPFAYAPEWGSLAILPLPERVARMRDPEVKARLVAGRAEPRRVDGAVRRPGQVVPAGRSAGVRARPLRQHHGPRPPVRVARCSTSTTTSCWPTRAGRS